MNITYFRWHHLRLVDLLSHSPCARAHGLVILGLYGNTDDQNFVAGTTPA